MRLGVRPSVLSMALVFVGVSALAAHLTLDGSAELTSREERTTESQRRTRRAARSSEPTAGRGAQGFSAAGGDYRRHEWGRESELARVLALGLPGPSFWQQTPVSRLRNDRQLAAMWRSFRGSVVEGEEEPDLPFQPTAYRGHVLDADGDVAGQVESCAVRVLPVVSHAAGFNCVIRVVCDGRTLYPNPTQSAGYVGCEVDSGRAVRAVDARGTSADGDPIVRFDSERNLVTVEDYDPRGGRQYRATIRLES